MINSAVSACYHPTTVLFVDDDEAYLKNLKFVLNKDKFIFQFSLDPQEALKYLTNYKANSFTRRCIARPEEEFFDHRSIDIAVNKIWREIYNPERFKEISVVVLDYAMPEMDGLTFAAQCRLLRNAPFKILLLTGEAGTDKAVEAFNNGVIDKFVRKNRLDFDDALNAAICELQEKYFQDLSQTIIDSLTKDPDHHIITWLDEPKFIELFSDICKKNAITEYYLSDAYGSYMFLDIYGNPSWLAVKDESEMQTVFQMACDSDTSFPRDLLDSLAQYKQIVYLHERGGVTYELDEIQASAHPTEKLKGNKGTFYYSYISNPKAYEIYPEDVRSYLNYRDAFLEK